MIEKIPESWSTAQLGEVSAVNPRLDKSKISGDLEVSFVPMPAVEAETGKINVSMRRPFADVEKGYTGFKQGDVLFAKITPCMENGKMAVVPNVHGGLAFGSTEFHVLRPSDGVLAKYLYYFVSSKCFRADAEHNMTGAVGQRRVPTTYLSEAMLPVPPIAEQRRIVETVEQLFSELVKGIENLKQARAQLAVYRQALLKHAFEGKLTADWRSKHADQLESAEQLLDGIRSKRDEEYRQRLSRWIDTVSNRSDEGVKESIHRKPRLPKEPSALGDDVLGRLPTLPSSWAWDALGWMTYGVEYGSATKSTKSGSHVVLRMGNLQGGKLDWEDLAFSSEQEEISQYILEAGDVLFNRTNSPEWVGKSAIYRGERPALFAGYLIRVNNSQKVVRSDYLNWFLNSPVAKQHGNTVKTDGVNQSNINGEKLVNYPFPYCSVLEQDEVVRALDELISLVDRSSEEIDTNLRKAEALRQSILKKAFAGELVPQDPNDEPAADLLVRIRAERAAAPASTKLRKTKAGASA